MKRAERLFSSTSQPQSTQNNDFKISTPIASLSERYANVEIHSRCRAPSVGCNTYIDKKNKNTKPIRNKPMSKHISNKLQGDTKNSHRKRSANNSKKKPGLTPEPKPIVETIEIPVTDTNGLYKHLKERTLDAIKRRKTFFVYGDFPDVRQALKKRGWIEIFPPKYKEELMHLTQNELLYKITEENRKESEAAIMSKMLGKHTPDFIWNNSITADVHYAHHQILSRMRHESFSNFTQKVGLCEGLEDMCWSYIEGLAEPVFPRCYKLNVKEHWEAFVDDFRITACVSLLEYISHKPNEELIHITGKIPLDIIDFAVMQCRVYMHEKLHLDIDETEHERKKFKPTDHDYNDFLYCYYRIVQHEKPFELDENNEMSQLKIKALQTVSKIKRFLPQYCIDGLNNVWIMKPLNLSRGRGIMVQQKLDEIEDILKVNPEKYIVQKYIERPLLIYGVKFDIRQHFLVTSTYPLTVWMYQHCYMRFSSQHYRVDNLHESIHLTNNAIQSHYKNVYNNDVDLPYDNMWHSNTFKQYLESIGYPTVWDKIINPGMRKSIIGTLLACQDYMDRRKNSFELYGSDFMITENFQPWLIEINTGPSLAPTTSITEVFCPKVIEDIMKVVLDYSQNSNASTGGFELLYRQYIPPIPISNYVIRLTGRKLEKTHFFRPTKSQVKLLPTFSGILQLQEKIAKQKEDKNSPEKIEKVSDPFQNCTSESVPDAIIRANEKPELVDAFSQVIDEPSEVMDEPSPVVDEPSSVHSSTAVIEKPSPTPAIKKTFPVVEKPSPSLTKNPSLVSKKSSSMSKKSSRQIERPPLVPKKLSSEIEKPSPVIDRPTQMIDKPSPVIDKPTQVINEPSQLIDKPAEVIDNSPTIDKPDLLIGASLTTDNSAQVTENTPVAEKSVIDNAPVIDKSLQVIENSPVIENTDQEIEKSIQVIEKPAQVIVKPSRGVTKNTSTVTKKIPSVTKKQSSATKRASSVPKKASSVTKKPSPVIDKPSPIIDSPAEVIDQHVQTTAQEDTSIAHTEEITADSTLEAHTAEQDNAKCNSPIPEAVVTKKKVIAKEVKENNKEEEKIPDGKLILATDTGLQDKLETVFKNKNYDELDKLGAIHKKLADLTKTISAINALKIVPEKSSKSSSNNLTTTNIVQQPKWRP